MKNSRISKVRVYLFFSQPTSWIPRSNSGSQRCLVAQSCKQNAYKLLSGEHGEQQGMLINNAELSAYGTPGPALSNLYYRLLIGSVLNKDILLPYPTNGNVMLLGVSDKIYTVICNRILLILLCIQLSVLGYIYRAGLKCFSLCGTDLFLLQCKQRRVDSDVVLNLTDLIPKGGLCVQPTTGAA